MHGKFTSPDEISVILNDLVEVRVRAPGEETVELQDTCSNDTDTELLLKHAP